VEQKVREIQERLGHWVKNNIELGPREQITTQFTIEPVTTECATCLQRGKRRPNLRTTKGKLLLQEKRVQEDVDRWVKERGVQCRRGYRFAVHFDIIQIPPVAPANVNLQTRIRQSNEQFDGAIPEEIWQQILGKRWADDQKKILEHLYKRGNQLHDKHNFDDLLSRELTQEEVAELNKALLRKRLRFALRNPRRGEERLWGNLTPLQLVPLS
jgi:hypothetical protein